jgi:hypothetical protein
MRAVPLTGRRFQSDVAISGNAVAVHNHADTALVPFGVEVAKRHHVRPASIKVAVAVQPECLCRGKSRHHAHAQKYKLDKYSNSSHYLCVGFRISQN